MPTKSNLWLVSLLSMLCVSCATIPDGVTAVKPFSINRYLGKWYEIARFDFRFEKDLENTTAEYSLNEDGTVKVLNRGFNTKTKEWKKAIGKAKSVGDPNHAMLKVSFFGPFYAGYNVIALDDNYKYALISGGSRDYLWILSREPVIPDDVKTRYLKIARDLGFDVGKLLWPSQVAR